MATLDENELIHKYALYIHEIIHKHRLYKTIDYDDLYSIGLEAIWHAIKNYKPEKSDLSTFTYYIIKQRLFNACKIKQVEFAERKLYRESYRPRYDRIDLDIIDKNTIKGQIIELLKSGYSHKEIRKKLDIKIHTFNKHLNRIRLNYE
jgi:DNA-directed RNA polymerase specialized sigma subunit